MGNSHNTCLPICIKLADRLKRKQNNRRAEKMTDRLAGRQARTQACRQMYTQTNRQPFTQSEKEDRNHKDTAASPGIRRERFNSKHPVFSTCRHSNTDRLVGTQTDRLVGALTGSTKERQPGIPTEECVGKPML